MLIAFASRALADTERGYAQIRKRLLFVLFGMEQFQEFTFGHQADVQSDHKPLAGVTKKPLLSAPN